MRNPTDPTEADRLECEAILDELNDLSTVYVRRPSALANRVDDLYRRLGLLASFWGINLPPARNVEEVRPDATT